MLSELYVREIETNNRSGKMFLEKYISNHYPDDYHSIIEYCNENNLNDLPFKERVYHVLHNIPNIVLCKNPNCTNRVKFHNSTIGYKDYCSNRCVGSDPNMIKQKENKSLMKFGTRTPAESDIIKQKIIDTNNKKYGGNSPMSDPDIQEKSRETLMENWGVDNPNKHPLLTERRIESFKKGVEVYKENYKKTSLERYGVEHPWMSKEIHNKTILKEKDNIINRGNIKLQKIGSKDIFIKIKDDGEYLINCDKCGSDYSICNYNFYYRTNNTNRICTVCNEIGTSYNTTLKESDVIDFISDNYTGEIISNTRDIISPYEIDIYLPDLKLAFEFNGLYWHSELHKSLDYHYLKSKMCEENGIQLIHIWEDDWVFKNEIVKSMILNKLNRSGKIYARKCIVREVGDNRLLREFLDNNHIQGFVGSKIKLGLFFGDELVSLMTFGGLRKSMGQSPSEHDFELMRFCNKINLSVIGGASKLFRHFIRNYKYNTILSYSDNSYSNGNLYSNLGFDLVDNKIKLNYYWVIDRKREHRYNYRKSNLVKKGYDKNKSEKEIMYEDVGSYRIWGSGNKKWIFQ